LFEQTLVSSILDRPREIRMRALSRRQVLAGALGFGVAFGLSQLPGIDGVDWTSDASATRLGDSTRLRQSQLAAGSVTARLEADFVDSIGVNIHASYTDTAYARSTQVIELLELLGVRHVRDELKPNRPDCVSTWSALGARGIKTLFIIGDPLDRWGYGTLQQDLDVLRTQLMNAADGIEGPNEFDGTIPEWQAMLRSYQAVLWESVQGSPTLRGLPVLAPSFSSPSVLAEAGTWDMYSNVSNIHPYAGGQVPTYNLVSQLSALNSIGSRTPIFATEAGYSNALNSSALNSVGFQPAVPESVAATYTLRTFLDYFLVGIHRTYGYELFDEWADPHLVNPQANFGLVRYDGSPKASYLALQNLLKILSSMPSTRSTTPRAISLSVLPNNGTDALLRTLLLQHDASTFDLVLWRDTFLYSTVNRSAIPDIPREVDVRLPAVSRVLGYDPRLSSSPSSVLSSGTSLKVPVSGTPVILRFTA